MLSQLLGRIHHNKTRIQVLVDPWVASSSCLGQHLNFKGNSQVKDNKIDLLVQQYEQFTILEEESIDSGFARFNTIITSLKALDEGFSSKNYVRKFLRALHPKWRAKQPREEKKSFRQRDEKKGKSDRKCFRCGDPNHLIGDCPKPPRNKDQKALLDGSDLIAKMTPRTKLTMKLVSIEVTLNSSYYSDNASFLDNDSMQIEYDNLCEISLKIINKNKVLKTKRDLLEKEILELNEKIKKLERNKEIDITCKSCQELKLENMRLKETQVKFVKFDKSANSLREMLNNQKLYSCKIGLGFDSSKASTSETKPINFVGSSDEITPDESTIKVHGSTIPASVDPSNCDKAAEHWHDLCPIRDMLTIRDITRSGFGLADSVSDCISNGHWRWPPDWLDRILGLSSILVPNLIVGYDDVRLWRDSQGNLKHFSVACAWDSVRLRANVVDWYHLVWFPQIGEKILIIGLIFETC
ncbi:zf-CCHC domain-containing protein [Tanacetum coccineum]